MSKAKSPGVLRLAAKTLMRQNIFLRQKTFYFCALNTLLECTILLSLATTSLGRSWTLPPAGNNWNVRQDEVGRKVIVGTV